MFLSLSFFPPFPPLHLLVPLALFLSQLPFSVLFLLPPQLFQSLFLGAALLPLHPLLQPVLAGTLALVPDGNVLLLLAFGQHQVASGLECGPILGAQGIAVGFLAVNQRGAATEREALDVEETHLKSGAGYLLAGGQRS